MVRGAPIVVESVCPCRSVADCWGQPKVIRSAACNPTLAPSHNRGMEFRLVYEGPLPAQGARSEHKWAIRRALHPQLAELWRQHPALQRAERWLTYPPREGETSVVVERSGVHFVPLVTSRLSLYAEVAVLLFRNQPRGAVLSEGGDVDNRLKTLIDGLRLPHGKQEIRDESTGGALPSPFYCLLEDDSLVTKASLESEQMLRPGRPEDVLAIISVAVKKYQVTHDNLGL